jgi:hypothetical protein
MYLLISIVIVVLLLLLLCGSQRDNFTQNFGNCKRNISCDLFIGETEGVNSCVTNDKEEGVCRGGFCCVK